MLTDCTQQCGRGAIPALNLIVDSVSAARVQKKCHQPVQRVLFCGKEQRFCKEPGAYCRAVVSWSITAQEGLRLDPIIPQGLGERITAFTKYII